MMTITSNLGVAHQVRVLYRIGVWVVHQGLASDGPYVVTHEPTKLAAVYHLESVKRAKEAARAMHKIPGNWNFSDKKRLTKRQIAAGKKVRRQYRGFP